jgi:hypothetical protein
VSRPELNGLFGYSDPGRVFGEFCSHVRFEVGIQEPHKGFFFDLFVRAFLDKLSDLRE